jgi:hypothetical protein
MNSILAEPNSFMVLSTIALILFLYLLLFVIFPNTDRRGRLVLATLVPAGLVLLDVGIAANGRGWAEELAKLLGIAVIIAPFCYAAPSPDTPNWIRGRWRILQIPFSLLVLVVLDLLTHFLPGWQHSKTLLPAVLSFAVVVALYRHWHARRI